MPRLTDVSVPSWTRVHNGDTVSVNTTSISTSFTTINDYYQYTNSSMHRIERTSSQKLKDIHTEVIVLRALSGIRYSVTAMGYNKGEQVKLHRIISSTEYAHSLVDYEKLLAQELLDMIRGTSQQEDRCKIVKVALKEIRRLYIDSHNV